MTVTESVTVKVRLSIAASTEIASDVHIYGEILVHFDRATNDLLYF
jgi:hypothetical protein